MRVSAGTIESDMDAASLDAAPIQHGGDLGAARLLFPGAPEPFIDLSTGINPFPYPIPHLPAELFTRLPEQAALDRLAALAARAYGAPSAAHLVAAPGTQILLPQVAALVRPGRAAVLGPTYAEHIRAAAHAGHQVAEVADLAGLRNVDLAIVVNPNNPDGRIVPRDALLACADALPAHGLLVVDEAFMDVCPAAGSLAPDTGRPNVVVLRSFGKFFGLAGVRLGFALAAPAVAARLRAGLGPWAVAGPAIAIGAAALQDEAWAAATRAASGASRVAARSNPDPVRPESRGRHFAVPAGAHQGGARAVPPSRARRHPGTPLPPSRLAAVRAAGRRARMATSRRRRGGACGGWAQARPGLTAAAPQRPSQACTGAMPM